MKTLSKKKAQDILSKIKKALPQKECTCCKEEDRKHKEVIFKISTVLYHEKITPISLVA